MRIELPLPQQFPARRIQRVNDACIIAEHGPQAAVYPGDGHRGAHGRHGIVGPVGTTGFRIQ